MGIQARVKLWLEDENGSPVLGEGTAFLLHLIDQKGSLNQAAQEMKMSYRAAWGLLNDLEERLGYPLLERQVGGNHGGGSQLTERGQTLLVSFGRLQERTRTLVAALYKEEFGS